MKGFVPTPETVVDLMLDKLFQGRDPAGARILDPGCGEGPFIDGVIRMCEQRGWTIPRIVGIEMDPVRASVSRARFSGYPSVEIRTADFLLPTSESYDFIVGNPPYVSITALDQKERDRYRRSHLTARGRFDLYLLFFEQALKQLNAGGRLVFITPEKFLYVETARPLRRMLSGESIEELHFLSESTFGDLVTYPLVSTIQRDDAVRTPTRIIRRNGSVAEANLRTSASWSAAVDGFDAVESGLTLVEISRRISCGVATGADGVYVIKDSDLTDDLRPFAHQTVSGRSIVSRDMPATRTSILAPYDSTGALLPPSQLGPLGDYLGFPPRRKMLEARTCAQRKPWYAFHDNLPLVDMLRPKLLCKDITAAPYFVVDEAGTVVPRHSVYYIVPSDPDDLLPLAEYLNSTDASEWLRAHCQRAANGFLRLQSHVLKQLPVPADRFAPHAGDAPDLELALVTA